MPRNESKDVLVSIRCDGVVLQPTPARIKKIQATIDDAVTRNDMAPHVANRLAGRLIYNFVTQSTLGILGAVGKAVLQPIYTRAIQSA